MVQSQSGPVYPSADEVLVNRLAEQLLNPKSAGEAQTTWATFQANFHPAVPARLQFVSRYRFAPEHRDQAFSLLVSLVLCGLRNNIAWRSSISGTPVPVQLLDALPSPDDHSSVSDPTTVLNRIKVVSEKLGDSAVQALSTSHSSALMTKYLEQELMRGSPAGTIAKIVQQMVKDAILRDLDDPFTTISAMLWRRSMDALQYGQDCLFPTDIEDAATLDDAIAQCLTTASELGVRRVARVLAESREKLRSSPPRAGKTDKWGLTESISVCGQCRMLFVFLGRMVMDDRVLSADFLHPDILFVPEDFNVVTCPYCGLQAPTQAPMFMYSTVRGQIIFGVPINRDRDQVDHDAAMENARQALQAFRKNYAGTLEPAEREAFDAASEVIAFGYQEFMRALHMGEVIAEDHVLNFVSHDDGGGVVLDTSKVFVRAMSPRDRERAGYSVMPSSALGTTAGGHRMGLKDIDDGLEREVAYHRSRLEAGMEPQKSRLALARLALQACRDPRYLEFINTRKY